MRGLAGLRAEAAGHKFEIRVWLGSKYLKRPIEALSFHWAAQIDRVRAATQELLQQSFRDKLWRAEFVLPHGSLEDRVAWVRRGGR